MQPATTAKAAATAAGEGSTAAELGETAAELGETAAAGPSAAATSATASPAGGAQDAAALIEAIPLAGENPPPLYPRLARQRGWEGLVALRVRVSAAGEVLEAWVEQSSGHGVLDQAALKAVQSWRFRPAREGLRAVAGVARVPIEFRLRGG
jgi:protein TonB